jgi:hypothetical protein
MWDTSVASWQSACATSLAGTYNDLLPERPYQKTYPDHRNTSPGAVGIVEPKCSATSRQVFSAMAQGTVNAAG